MSARWTEEQLADWQARGVTLGETETEPRQGGLDLVLPCQVGIVYARIGGNAPPQPRPRATLVPTGKWAELAARARTAQKIGDLAALFRAQVYSAPREHPVTAWKKTARGQLSTARDRAGFPGPIVPKGRPLEVVILSVRELAKSRHRKGTPVVRRWETSPNAGDWDNVAKPVCDAANGILWHDDCEVARASVEQIVGAQGEEPRLEIIARPLGEIPERTRFEHELERLMEDDEHGRNGQRDQRGEEADLGATPEGPDGRGA